MAFGGIGRVAGLRAAIDLGSASTHRQPGGDRCSGELLEAKVRRPRLDNLSVPVTPASLWAWPGGARPEAYAFTAVLTNLV